MTHNFTNNLYSNKINRSAPPMLVKTKTFAITTFNAKYTPFIEINLV